MIDVHTLTPERWEDFEALMGPRGGADGCWCMLWRQSAKGYRENRGTPNRSAMQSIVAEDQRPGLLACLDGVPVGWISIAPRDRFPRLAGSKVMAPVDGRDSWVVSCFFVAKAARGKQVPLALLNAACVEARARGAQIVEGYPIDPLGQRYQNAFAWTGYKAVFDAAGFTEVARRSEKRPVMRRVL